MSLVNVSISQLNAAASVIGLVMLFVNFIPGIIGLVFNILVFTRPNLRREPCSLYFFSATCFNLFVILVVLPVRTLSNSFNIDMTNYNLGICKIEYFTFYSARATACWFIVLACVDRFLHSSTRAHIRRISSLKTAKFAIGIASITIPILYSHILVYYEITNVYDQFGNIVPSCNGRKGIYRTFISLWRMTLYSLLPSFLMLLFGYLTLRNLRQHHQVVRRANEINRIGRRTDMQLVRMLATQVFVMIITTLPYSIYQLYASFTATLAKDTFRLAQESLAGNTLGEIAYFAHSSTFYLFSLSGTIFRKELYKIIRRCRHSSRNRVHLTDGRAHQTPVMHNASIGQ